MHVLECLEQDNPKRNIANLENKSYIYIYIYSHRYQNMNRIINRFLIFVFFHIVYRKIYKHLIKFIKNYRYTYINGIFIINFEYI